MQWNFLKAYLSCLHIKPTAQSFLNEQGADCMAHQNVSRKNSMRIVHGFWEVYEQNTPRQFFSSLREGGQVDCCTVVSASRTQGFEMGRFLGVQVESLAYWVYWCILYTAYLLLSSLFALSLLCTAFTCPSCPCLSKLLDHNVIATWARIRDSSVAQSHIRHVGSVQESFSILGCPKSFCGSEWLRVAPRLLSKPTDIVACTTGISACGQGRWEIRLQRYVRNWS